MNTKKEIKANFYLFQNLLRKMGVEELNGFKNLEKKRVLASLLDRLNRTMGAICGAIQETNFLLGDISRTLGRIETNTALTAYNSQCIAHNTRIASQYVL